MTGRAVALAGCFVEASAGTGKTRALVNAIADAIAQGVAVERIVAVTFTHQAAGEMKLRVRQRLGEIPTEAAKQAVQTLDRAFIGTIHSFCGSLLRQRPVEARVDPEFAELDEGEARRLFGRVFRTWIESRLEPPSPVLKRALAREAWREDRDSPFDALEEAAWSLATWRDHDAPWEKRDIEREPEVLTILDRARRMVTLWPGQVNGRSTLADLVRKLDGAREAGVFDLDDAEAELLSIRKRLQWVEISRKTPAGQEWAEFIEAVHEYGRKADADLASRLRDHLWSAVDAYQNAKQTAGQLDFTDLLLYARELLRDDNARDELSARYDRFFVDEFQDTDPLQAEILRSLAGLDKLFVVGDPKQSIYRFRRADPSVYSDFHRQMTDAGADEQQLSVSHRSNDAIQQFVNAAFESSIPGYLPLRGGPAAPDTQPSVIGLPMPQPYGEYGRLEAKPILACAPPTVAGFIEWLLTNPLGWRIRGKTKIEARDICILFRRFTNNGRDLTQDYVRSLEARGIRHVLVGSKGLHSREETAVIRTALRAIEWPEDELSVYAVLRGPLFGLPDDTLFRFRETHGRLRPYFEASPDLDEEFEPVVEALSILFGLHNQRNRRPIADTLRRLSAAVRAHATLAFQKGAARRLANLNRLAEMARLADGKGLISFRGFVGWLEDEAESGEAAEAPVLEQGAEGVRLMTVHKAKGLEFPIVILADPAARLTSPTGCSRWLESDRGLCAQRLLWCAPWELADPEHQRAEEKAEEEEATRVAYVAATRACDLLVVCATGSQEYPNGWLSPLYDALYPPADRRSSPSAAPGCPEFGRQTVLNGPMEAMDSQIRPGLHRPRRGTHAVVWWDPQSLRLQDPPAEDNSHRDLLEGDPSAGLAQYRAWAADRAAAVERGSAPSLTVRRATDAGRVPEAESIDVKIVSIEALPQRPAGRRFGRLLHLILQSGGRHAAAHGKRLDATAQEVTAAEETARFVLAHPLLSTEGCRVFREMPVLVRLEDGTLIEGRADLAFTDGQSWTIVDYKTGVTDAQKGKRQLQLYAYALQRATGLPASAVLLEI